MTLLIGSSMLTARTPLPRSDAPTRPLYTPQTQAFFAGFRRCLQDVQAPLRWIVDALGASLTRLAVCPLFCRHRYDVCTISAGVLPDSVVVRQHCKDAWPGASSFVSSASRCGGKT